MKARLIINLRSDCLPGSGTGVGAYIDTDCVFDRYGFPEIPGRRLKGCLRETAEKLLAMGYQGKTQEDILALFGDEHHEGTFLINNAQVEGIDKIRQAIDYYKVKCSTDKTFILQPDAISEYYTNIHTRTAIDANGCARDHSLRTVRALRKGIVFTCDVSFPEHEKEFIELCAKALRYIGTTRNRGFGAVEIVLDISDCVFAQTESMNDCDAVELVLCLKTPVITDEMYIPGVMIRGALAAVYMKRHPAPASGDYGDDETFRKFFLQDLRFEPALPTDGEYRRYSVVPSSVVRYKVPEKGKSEYTDLSVANRPDAQTKSMSSGSVYAPGSKNEKMFLLRSARSRQMHHSMSGALFSYDALEANNLFRTRISGNKESISLLTEFICEGDELRLGKSKGAQYGCARIEKIRRTKQDEETICAADFVATLQTPAILLDEYGTPASDCRSLLHEVEGKTGYALKLNRSFAASGNIEGYNPQWKLSKQAVPGLQSGTTIVFSAENKVSLPREIWLGERNQEGYGLLRIETTQERKRHAQFDSQKASILVIQENEPQDIEWKLFLENFDIRYIKQQLQLNAIKKTIRTKNIRVIIQQYNQKRDCYDTVETFANLGSSTLQDIYTLALKSKDHKSFLESISTIKDEKKKAACLVMCDSEIGGWFNEAINRIFKTSCPSVISSQEEIQKSWMFRQFYLAECLKNSIIALNTERRKKGK